MEPTRDAARYNTLNELADRIAARHWHVRDLPWSELPPLPVPADADDRRRRAIVAFGKRAIDVQLDAEHVAVTAAHYLLQHAVRAQLDPSVTRALAAVLNDEASHVGVMHELRIRTAETYPDVETHRRTSPLFAAFVERVPRLHPAVVAIAIGTYEAMIAIRSYVEEAGYRHPSILGCVADRAAQDDALHAKVFRLVSRVLLDRLLHGLPDDASRASTMRAHVLEPLRGFWPLVCEHERFLLDGDTRYEAELDRRLTADAALIRRFMASLGITAPELTETPVARD